MDRQTFWQGSRDRGDVEGATGLLDRRILTPTIDTALVARFHTGSLGHTTYDVQH
jgi:hypothetical protein